MCVRAHVCLYVCVGRKGSKEGKEHEVDHAISFWAPNKWVRVIGVFTGPSLVVFFFFALGVSGKRKTFNLFSVPSLLSIYICLLAPNQAVKMLHLSLSLAFELCCSSYTLESSRGREQLPFLNRSHLKASPLEVVFPFGRWSSPTESITFFPLCPPAKSFPLFHIHIVSLYVLIEFEGKS